MRFTLASIIAAVYLAGQARAAAWTGCVTSYNSLPGFPSRQYGVYTPEVCQTACINYGYAFFHQATGSCYCSTRGIAANALSTGSQSSCNGYSTYKVQTTFTGASCYEWIVWDWRDFDPPTNPDDAGGCFERCRNHRYAIMHVTGRMVGLRWQAVWNCKCANFPFQSTNPGSCSASGRLLFEHSADAAASGLTRREERLRIKRQQEALAINPHCPPTYTACQVSEDRDDGYECLRPNVELESCGGCRFGRYDGVNATLGVDCTALPGVLPSGVQCHEGGCIVSQCRRGHRLIDGECVRR